MFEAISNNYFLIYCFYSDWHVAESGRQFFAFCQDNSIKLFFCGCT